MLGVTEATGIWGMEAEENEEYEDAQEVMGEEEEVTGEFFSKLGEFSHALRADSIWKEEQNEMYALVITTQIFSSITLDFIFTFSVRSTVAGETVLRLELCCKVSRRGRGKEWGSATYDDKS